jgi:hypothetical protein
MERLLHHRLTRDCRGIFFKRLREPPIDDPHTPSTFDTLREHISWLQIAVQDASSMCVRHTSEHLQKERDTLAHRKFCLATRRGERLTLHDRHREERPPIRRTSSIVDGDDRGVVQFSESHALGFESAERAH